jgi:pimeloyl-ACP methyl ester carboxylesterase
MLSKVPPASGLAASLMRFPALTLTDGHWQVQFRQSGNAAIAPTHVLLHGIGSGSASWVQQLQAVEDSPIHRVLAWDAPGYAGSSALLDDAPLAAAYAARLWQWLDAMGQGAMASVPPSPITLVGHSLGCLIAARAACMAPARVSQLVLLAPAQGYARASAALRQKKLQDRLDALASLGPLGLAQRRGSAMLSAHASPEQIAFVQDVMATIQPHGYRQAAHLLAGGDLLADLAQVTCKVQVASGSADGITPMAGCQALANAVNAPYVSLGEVGHVCALEAPLAVSQLIGLIAQSDIRDHSGQSGPAGQGAP